MSHKVENHWGIWVDSDTPITGVAQNNHVEWLNEEIYSGIDLAYEEHVNSNEHEEENCDICEFWESPDSDILIGKWLTDEEGKYYPDPNGEYAAICGEIYTQVVYSKFTKRCALCSPCYPGQGDLDTPGDFLTYDLPPDLYGDTED